MNSYLEKRNSGHISFETHNTKEDYAQKILADINKPNVLVGEGMNCYDYILNDYNTYFKKNYQLIDFFKKKT